MIYVCFPSFEAYLNNPIFNLPLPYLLLLFLNPETWINSTWSVFLISWFSLSFHIYSYPTLTPQKPLNWIRYIPQSSCIPWLPAKSQLCLFTCFVNIYKQCVLTARYIKVVLSEVKHPQFSQFAVTASPFTLALFQFLFYIIMYRFFPLMKLIWIPLISTCSFQIFLVSFFFLLLDTTSDAAVSVILSSSTKFDIALPCK